ncbi:nuclear transport factor 2 family protein [Poritiphilus flavus]|uniref:Lumazine-binding n=1 Tax=Poritiphilus flavus TaxID=2697053 RepID=A0A6L9EA36_9FLAO|nr:nuclear transport factor 2 family protein [Poritiphilus flavus]NAS11432.1 hypothetical protein [Poritiphilus flavus]
MNNEEKIIQQITKFLKGGDTSDLELLDQALHDKYINVQNGYFGEKGIYIIDKERYFSLISNKTFGGNPRKMEVNSIDIEGNIAMVKVSLESSELKFKSFISLVQIEDSSWKVIGNFPHVMPNLRNS